MAGATAPAVFFGARPAARAQEGQLEAPHRISRSRRFPYLRLHVLLHRGPRLGHPTQHVMPQFPRRASPPIPSLPRAVP